MTVTVCDTETLQARTLRSSDNHRQHYRKIGVKMKRNRRLSGIACSVAIAAGLVVGAPAAQAATPNVAGQALQAISAHSFKESAAGSVFSCKKYNHPWCP